MSAYKFVFSRGIRTTHEGYDLVKRDTVWIGLIDEAEDSVAEMRVWHEPDAKGLALEAYDDAWPIFVEIPTLATELGQLDADPSLDDVAAMLRRLGAEQRDAPSY